jgi:hypothetical protein
VSTRPAVKPNVSQAQVTRALRNILFNELDLRALVVQELHGAIEKVVLGQTKRLISESGVQNMALKALNDSLRDPRDSSHWSKARLEEIVQSTVREEIAAVVKRSIVIEIKEPPIW